MNFAEYTSRWQDNVEAVTSVKTQKARRFHIRKHILPEFGKLDVSDVTQSKAQEFVSKLSRSGLAPKTVQNVWGTVRTILADAERDMLILKVPKPRLSKVGSPEQPRFAVPEVRDILRKAPDAPSRLLYHLLAETGVRIDEALSLEWNDVKATYLRVRGTKTASARRDLVISRSLREQLTAQRGPGEWRIFTMSETYYRDRLNALLQVLDIPCLAKAPFHAFRRFNRTLCGQLGMPDSLAELRLGHALPGVEGKYRFLTLEEQEPWVEQIAEAIR